MLILNYIFIYLYILFNIFPATLSYSISFPTFTKNKAIISNIDVKSATSYEINQFKKIFYKIPVIIYKNQKLSPNQYYDFVKLFDCNHDNDISLYNHIQNSIPSVPHVELIQNKNKCNRYINLDDEFNYLWHQDVTGSDKYITPIVSSMYMLSSPSHGDDTIFASYEDAYDLMSFNFKKYIENLTVIHSISKQRQDEAIYDYTGLRNDLKYRYNDDNFTETPFVIYSDKYVNKKTLALNPKKFLRFKELNYDDSNNLFRHIMKKYVTRNDNIISHHWDDYDLCIFNNRKLIHTSSPKVVYNNKDRIYLQCRLATKSPLLKLIK
tara:strand:+ start:6638 stop:7606 length:969 start_codon:yes stop_codon:yes gene_type:complete